MKILIAEDDFTSRSILAGVLKKEGHEVTSTVNGAEANDYLAKPFDRGELRARIGVGLRMIEMQEALVESREKLSYLATHDPLTGLQNRRAILDRLREELARSGRHGDVLAVGMCDIDHFKKVNDTYGHQTGDDILCGLAQIFSENSRMFDSTGRLGGEEFLLITPLKAGTNWISVYDRLCAKIAESNIMTRTGVQSITVSIGVVCASVDSTVDETLEAADKAMYRAKNAGRNRVVAHEGQCTSMAEHL
jgi:diguanylate cyclase (GGDEF)-like protein